MNAQISRWWAAVMVAAGLIVGQAASAQPTFEKPARYAPTAEERAEIEAKLATLARAIDEVEGPVYVHCHHGKHRSAAAVATACVMNGRLKPGQAESVLKTFGTGGVSADWKMKNSISGAV